MNPSHVAFFRRALAGSLSGPRLPKDQNMKEVLRIMGWLGRAIIRKAWKGGDCLTVVVINIYIYAPSSESRWRVLQLPKGSDL